MAPPSGCRTACVLVAALLLVGLSPPTLAQQITYEYDALGRLILMTSPEGVAQWEYDAVGNILRITTRRYADVSGPVAILGMNPTTGAPGMPVTLYGRGFGATPAENQVAFNGTSAPVTAATTGTLTVTVPAGATTGPVSVTAPQGSATSADAFTVLQALAILPEQTDVVLRGVVGFQATLAGAPAAAVTWRVNGVAGGNATVGTISATGLYTAPNTAPPVQPVPVEAVLTADTTQIARASVRVVGQAAGIEAAAPVSVGVRATSAPAASAPLSVGVQPTSAPAASASVSVARTAQSAPVAAGPVTVTGGPVLTGVLPADGAVGASAVAVILAGGNLQNATVVRFLRNGSVDSTVTAGTLTPGSDGTSLGCLVTIDASAPQGVRVVQVVTPQGTSNSFTLGANAFTVTAP